jgi:exopolysaccharide biosynthesis polyprenyl glycosylphosphotransferase
MQCGEQGIIVRFGLDPFACHRSKAYIDYFADDYVVTVDRGAMRSGKVVFKYFLDFVLSAILLVALAPVFLVTAALIKFTSEGPVFFTQERLGLGKRRFKVYKFRTMVVDAESRQAELEHKNEVDGPVFKIMHDPRITAVGRFLRKTSIDELPQLFNVIKGEMSLVGPRPLPVRDCEGFSENWHRRRFSVRPGITCLWQVEGRNSIPFEEWMKLDMRYIDNWSIWLDVKILFKTIPTVLRGSGV